MHVLEIRNRGEMNRNARYAVLRRIRSLADARSLRFMAFDCVQDLRLILDGGEDDAEAVWSLARSLKSSVTQVAATRKLTLEAADVRRVVDPAEALISVHRRAVAGGDPLSTPWSSHRDLMGFRRAAFFDASVWKGVVEPVAVHRACGGGPLPRRRPAKPRSNDLDLPFRVSAAVLGVLPADPAAFPLFSQLARWAGQHQQAIADALLLTPRRVRQLLATPDPRLPVAVACLTDRRLCNVP